jgi:hypothetical protein
LARWRNHFFQLLNIHGFIDARQTEIHTGEPLVSEPSAFKFEFAIEKLKSHKSPGIDQLPAELWQRVDKLDTRSTNLLFLFGTRRNLSEERKESVIVPIYKKGDKTDCINPYPVNVENMVSS